MEKLNGAQPTKIRHTSIWLPALITLAGTFGMHVFVPALPVAADTFRTSPAVLQFTVSGYIIGLATGQLVYGHLSDRIGRKRALVVGLFLYTCAGLAGACASSAQALILARIVQGFGGSVGIVLPRAIIRDMAGEREATRRMAIVNLIVTAAPGTAPMIGGMLTSTFGWRAVLYSLFGFGLLNMLLILATMKEAPATPQSASHRPTSQSFSQLLRSPAFLCYAIAGSLATTSWYAFITAAPFILASHIHRSASDTGFFLACIMLFVWIGSFITSIMSRRWFARRLLLIGASLSIAGSLAFVGLAISGNVSLPGVLATMSLYALGVGVAAAPAVIVTIGVKPGVTGSASGLYGFCQMIVGASCSTLAAIGGNATLEIAAILLASSMLALLLIFMPAYLARR
jgi:DHA1 family bicyclomycin/chloramphenicol resistance-like MFS transporter